jgi:hypothetical protein
MQMRRDFEKKVVICELLFLFRKKTKKKMHVYPLICQTHLIFQYHKLIINIFIV